MTRRDVILIVGINLALAVAGLLWQGYSGGRVRADPKYATLCQDALARSRQADAAMGTASEAMAQLNARRLRERADQDVKQYC